MRHKKRKLDEKSTACILMRTVLLCFAIWCAMMINGRKYSDRKECVCSVLTAEEQTLKIDERLNQICRIEDMSSGTFTIISMWCDHECRLWLKIDKDAGTYQGRIVN